MDCCPESKAYDAMFSRKFSQSLVRRYERRGLTPLARRVVDFLASRGLDGATVLEIGGGVGALEVDLLRRGASFATNLEISSSYDDDARLLMTRHGFAERMTRRSVDIARTPEAVESADIVVLHRVVCCYPDVEALLSAAASHAKLRLVFSYPTFNLAQRASVQFENAWNRLRHREFRAYVHDPTAMTAVVERAGFRQVMWHRGFAWSIAGFERATA